MKKNKHIKSEFPTLWRLVKAAIETAQEIEQGKRGLAFFNNLISFGVVAGSLPELANEAISYEKSSENKAVLQAAILDEFDGKNDDLIIVIFEHVVPLVFMNIGGGFALERAVRKHKEKKESEV